MTQHLQEIAAFVAVADSLSFQRAALGRGVTRSTLSHAVKTLEQRLGVRLLNRTTRSVSLTEAGRALHARARQALGELDQAIEAVDDFRTHPVGALRLTVPRAVSPSVIGALASLVATHPNVSVEIDADDRLVDIVAEGFDAGIRFGINMQQDMIAVRLDRAFHFAVVGSPTYLIERDPPMVPADLRHHQCILYRLPSGVLFPWTFERGGEISKVDVTGPLIFNDQSLMIEAALQGAGLAFVFEERARPHLDSGDLLRCLPEFTPQFSELFLYYSGRHHVSAALRALIDALKTRN
ncbi:transcriptional regulator [Sphingomonas sp. Leaf231]|uniref:LysR family transcriptional regulator n=1 Tax=Sphingomonas sp. Leaf231 TaxID=1736301 RepID=UPI0006FE207B|nr:LysR family transcriptional regulator [Sphingomonas sp. Leaf231]KQN90138.1 transcriptional regulator [Sphingomonas sp. Leaf231]